MSSVCLCEEDFQMLGAPGNVVPYPELSPSKAMSLNSEQMNPQCEMTHAHVLTSTPNTVGSHRRPITRVTAVTPPHLDAAM